MKEHADADEGEEEVETEPAVLKALGLSKSALELCDGCTLVEEKVPISKAPIEPLPGCSSSPSGLRLPQLDDQPHPEARGSKEPAPQEAITTDIDAAEPAAPSLWQGKDAQIMLANRSALEALRLAGGDPIIEGQIARRISRLEAKKQCTAHPSARFAREQALARGTAQQAYTTNHTQKHGAQRRQLPRKPLPRISMPLNLLLRRSGKVKTHRS